MKKQYTDGSIFLKGVCLFMSFLFLLSNAFGYYILNSNILNSKVNQHQISDSSKEKTFQISENDIHNLKSQVFVEFIEALEFEDDETPCVLILGSVSLFKTFSLKLFSCQNFPNNCSLYIYLRFLLFKAFRL